MNKRDFLLYFLAWPFLGGFLGLVLGIVLQVGSSSCGIMVMLGVISGYMALVTYLFGMRYCRADDETTPIKKEV